MLKREYLAVEVAWVKGRTAFENALKGLWGYDLLFVGDPLGELSVEEAITLAGGARPGLPVILLPAAMDEQKAGQWLRQGALDCIPWSGLGRLAPAVRRTLRESRDRAALREAEADGARLVSLLRTVLEATSEGILVVDLAGRVTTYNRKFMSLCGIPEYVMAPMELDRVLQFLQDQFADPEAFMGEARMLADHAERRPLGMLNLKNRRAVQAYGRSQRAGGETVGRVFSFVEVAGREQAAQPQEPSAIATDLLEAARAGRVVPWYLTEEELVISEKGQKVLDLPPGGLPRDLPALEALIHPEDLEALRQGLEHPQTAPFTLRMKRGDGEWILTRWNLKRGTGGYRGIFTELPAPPRPAPAPQPPVDLAAQFSFKIQVYQEERQIS
jgi:PAS domain-containing protein